MKQYLEKLGYTTAATFYLFICGALYSFFFWSTFNFDITNLITVSDIPKSIFTALFLAIGIFGISCIYGFLILLATSLNKILRNIMNFIVAGVCYYFIFQYNRFYIVFVVIIFIVLVICFLFYTGIIKYIKENKESIVFFTLMIPVLCAGIGVINGGTIKSNSDRTNYVNQMRSSDSILVKSCLRKKLIGYVGDKIVLSDIQNSEFIVVNQSSLNAISFTTDTSLLLSQK